MNTVRQGAGRCAFLKEQGTFISALSLLGTALLLTAKLVVLCAAFFVALIGGCTAGKK